MAKMFIPKGDESIDRALIKNKQTAYTKNNAIKYTQNTTFAYTKDYTIVYTKYATDKSNLYNHPIARDYPGNTYLANLFSEVKGVTIEKFYLAHKIERVKELIVYDELSLKEIAYRMHYSSVAHLSHQFKKITGLTPSHIKKR